MDFSNIYTKYYRTIYNLSFRILGNSELAKDITQETFEKLYNSSKMNFTQEDTDKLINIIKQESNIFTSKQKEQLINRIKWKSSLSNEDKERFRKKIEEELNIPDPIVNTLPLYHTLKIDSDNNLLVFVYVDKEKTIECKVYTLEGKYICDTKFVSDEYKIDISKFQFYDRYVYGLFPLKETEGISLRLVKMKLTN